MKTSKLILISFISIIMILLISLVFGSYIYNDREKYKPDEYGQHGDDYKSIILKDKFSHVKVEKKCKVLILKGTGSITYLPVKSRTVAPEYDIRNDTLFIRSTLNQTVTVSLRKEDVKSVSAEDAVVFISMDLPSLTLDFKNVYANLNKLKIPMFNICLREHTSLLMHDIYTDRIKLKIDNSRFHCFPHNKLALLSGTIENGSETSLPSAAHIDLYVDKTSKLRVYAK